jgi:hypothetical protein
MNDSSLLDKCKVTFCLMVYSQEISKKAFYFVNPRFERSSDLHMKKLLGLSAVLIAAAAVSSHAGVSFGFGVGLPLPVPPLPGIVVGQPCEPAPPPVYYNAPRAYYGAPTVVVQPPPVYYGTGRGYYHSYPHHRGHKWAHHRHDRYGGHRW